jgi:hypothetical protein
MTTLDVCPVRASFPDRSDLRACSVDPKQRLCMHLGVVFEAIGATRCWAGKVEEAGSLLFADVRGILSVNGDMIYRLDTTCCKDTSYLASYLTRCATTTRTSLSFVRNRTYISHRPSGKLSSRIIRLQPATIYNERATVMVPRRSRGGNSIPPASISAPPAKTRRTIKRPKSWPSEETTGCNRTVRVASSHYQQAIVSS